MTGEGDLAKEMIYLRGGNFCNDFLISFRLKGGLIDVFALLMRTINLISFKGVVYRRFLGGLNAEILLTLFNLLSLI